MYREMDDTLPDDAWKDSFDRLLDARPTLRELNIIKENVRASFNIDSSVDNSNVNMDSVSDSFNQNQNMLTIGVGLGPIKRGNAVSTPCVKRLNRFQCALSPITGIKLDGLHTDAKRATSEDGHLAGKIHPRALKHVCFEQDISERTELKEKRSRKASNEILERRSSIVLQPGKWRKSLNTWRRTNLNEEAPCVLNQKTSLPRKSSHGLRGSQLAQRKSIYALGTELEEINHEREVLKYCGQKKALKFNTTYTSANMIDAIKIGEGVYGEVFKYIPKNCLNTNVVLKCIPIEGDMAINGEVQKTYEQILPEIIISQQMSNLRDHRINSTSGFVSIHQVCLVKGKYPPHLIKLWEDFDARKESENEHPEIFTDSQLFIVLELKFAGTDMSEFIFLNAEQSFYALQQVILTLAVGEEAFQFEHRDLHLGNILIEKTDEEFITYKLNGKNLSVASKGVRITIIDYTLSRITVGKCCHYNDLSTDGELFEATGDYQYDIYRMMRDELSNDWSKYAPKTNVLWLSYVVSKLIDGVSYKSPKSRAHKKFVEKLEAYNKIILEFDSAVACANYIQNQN